jgi:hypothetical protein
MNSRHLAGALLVCGLAVVYACAGPKSEPNTNTPGNTRPDSGTATCGNNVIDPGEADVDCGGICAKTCALNATCRAGTDCITASCGNVELGDNVSGDAGADASGLGTAVTTNARTVQCKARQTECRCLAPSTTDGAKNGAETDVDCGGGAAKCTFAKGCAADNDCVSGKCTADKCAPSVSDGSRNGAETDIDCGGGEAGPCVPGRKCAVGSDCESGSCVGKICQVATSSDNVQNLQETDADCGGPQPTSRCAVGKRCRDASDCTERSCDAVTKLCRQPAINGQKDGNETDIDCGGPGAPPCATGKVCGSGTDCESRVCTGAMCAAPTGTDGQQNADESDVDCGGTLTNAQRCVVGKVCAVHGDCASDGCGYNNRCAERRSCTARIGGDTCGKGEVGEPGNQHESCCTSIQVQRPGGAPVKLGKYNVTAGRMRTFIERVNGDVRGAVANSPKWATFNAYTTYLPTTLAQAYADLGPVPQPWEWPAPNDPDYPRADWVARGCQIENGGARTLYQNVAGDNHRYPQDILDAKTLNCVTKVMLLAFCIWDGGDLPLVADQTWAWTGPNNNLWPWGAAPGLPTTSFETTDYIAHRYSYRYPAYIAPDATYNVPAPGRKFRGAGPFGHMDLAGTLYQFSRDALFQYNGSWENHTPEARGTGGGTPFQMWNRRYYAMGGRCAYPI